MLQNTTPSQKIRALPPNISGGDVSGTAPATRHASLHILFKRPAPNIDFGIATKPSPFAHFWQGAESLAPATKGVEGPKLFLTCHKGVRCFVIATSKTN